MSDTQIDRSIVRDICKSFALDFDDVFCRSDGKTGQINRTRIYTNPRARVISHIRATRDWSYPRIGRAVGMAHSTIIECLKREGLHRPSFRSVSSPRMQFRPIKVLPPTNPEMLRCR